MSVCSKKITLISSYLAKRKKNVTLYWNSVNPIINFRDFSWRKSIVTLAGFTGELYQPFVFERRQGCNTAQGNYKYCNLHTDAPPIICTEQQLKMESQLQIEAMEPTSYHDFQLFGPLTRQLCGMKSWGLARCHQGNRNCHYPVKLCSYLNRPINRRVQITMCRLFKEDEANTTPWSRVLLE
jgi:hypothetical protein